LLFNTLDFVIFFILICAAIVIIKNRKSQQLLLLLGSFFFFYYSSNYLIFLLLFSTLLDYYVAQEIWKSKSIRKKKALLITSLSANLGLLGFFKYADFAILQFNLLGQTFDLGAEFSYLGLVLPIGISFYTFQTISYTVDVYRGQLTPTKSLSEFALFVTFFPQLVAGPIVKARDFLPQLRERTENLKAKFNLRKITIEPANLKLGVTIMAIGFFKKMFFADNIAPLVDSIYANPIGAESATIWLAAIGFGIQLYCDFSGYSDIAIGAALVLGFKLPLNFKQPFFSTSTQDFRRRWHVSLFSWFKSYLYIPLGGNRVGKKRTFFNLWIVMFLAGLWHGASWNFVIYGALHGAYLAIPYAIREKFPILKGHPFFKSKIGIVLSILGINYLFFFSWIVFRIRDLDHLLYAMQKFVILDFAYEKTLEIMSLNKLPILLIVIFIVLNIISYKSGNLRERIASIRLGYWFIFLLSIAFAIIIMYDANPQQFIYFKF